MVLGGPWGVLGGSWGLLWGSWGSCGVQGGQGASWEGLGGFEGGSGRVLEKRDVHFFRGEFVNSLMKY